MKPRLLDLFRGAGMTRDAACAPSSPAAVVLCRVCGGELVPSRARPGYYAHAVPAPVLHYCIPYRVPHFTLSDSR